MTPATASLPLDVPRIRQDFPALTTPFHGKRLIYLDSAVSGLTPRPVVERMAHYQSYEHTNVHRGVSTLSQEATDRFEEAREKVRAFINAPSAVQIIWTRGTTESINLVAQTFGRARGGGRATRSCSRPWSTTPTSCPGRSWPRRRARGSGSSP